MLHYNLSAKNKIIRFIPLFIFSFLLIFGQSFTYGKEVKTSVDIDKLDNYIKKARKAWNVPGMAVAIVKNGKIVLAKGYGLKNFSKKDQVDKNTLFAIASNTKAFGSAALSMLVDEGKMKWDDKVQKYLPYFKLYDPYVSAEITIRDLLSHRSGLGTFSGDLLWYETSYSTVDILKRARFLKQKYGFRSGFGYSNIAFMAAGEVVAAITGKPWKDFIKERFFKPLNMIDTNIGTSELKKYNNVASPHYVKKGQKTVTVPYTTSDSTGAAASINSSVSDMANWLMMLLNKGKVGDKQLISQKGLEEMWTPYNSFKVSSRYNKMFPSTHFRSYGLGWGLNDYHGKKVISHSGALDGMISRVALVPEEKLGLVILTNSINGVSSPLTYKIIDTFLDVPSKDWSALYLERSEKRSKKKNIKKKENKIIKKQKLPQYQINLKEYTGIYGGLMYGDAKIILKEGKLILDLLPSPIFISDLSPLHYDTFNLQLRNTFSFIPGGKGTVQFIRNNKGKIIEFKLDIPNNDFHFYELEFIKKK